MSTQSSISHTEQLCAWAEGLSTESIPTQWLERAKYLVLDGIACGLTSAALPVSAKAVQAFSNMEPGGGACSVIGHKGIKLTPCTAAMLNSSFIQGFELDDWHKDAPIHATSVLVPALLAATEHQMTIATKPDIDPRFSGKNFLLSMMVGYEIAPRIGLALRGRQPLTDGWHSGALFGSGAAAAAVGHYYGLTANEIEDAIGIACTQTGGLMSAQFESDVKRMQHGFAARNGLLGVFLAQSGYIGIKRVFEREYGGFLTMFSKGNGKKPNFIVDELTKDLGNKWQIEGLSVKPYAAMAGTHAPIDCVRALQAEHGDLLKSENFEQIASININLEEVMFHHGGWKAERPLRAIGAQMSCAFTAATQLVDNQVLAAQFKQENLDNDTIWSLINKTQCRLARTEGAEVEIIFKDGTVIQHSTNKQRGMDPPLTNDEIVDKWRALAKEVIDEERMTKIEEFVLKLEDADNLTPLVDLLISPTRSPLA